MQRLVERPAPERRMLSSPRATSPASVAEMTLVTASPLLPLPRPLRQMSASRSPLTIDEGKNTDELMECRADNIKSETRPNCAEFDRATAPDPMSRIQYQ